MGTKFKMSTDISVSSIYTDPRCSFVIEALHHAGIDCRVTPNVSIHAKKIEYGCSIRLPGTNQTREKIKETWEVAKLAGRYECAHLEIDGQYSGCALNYIYAPNLCVTQKHS